MLGRTIDETGNAATDFLLPSSFSASPSPEQALAKPRGGGASPSMRSDGPVSWRGGGGGNHQDPHPSGRIRRDGGWRRGGVVAAASGGEWWRR